MTERGTVSGEVARLIIGPLRRLPGGGWDWRRQSKRSLEAAVASWVIARLEDEGHNIADLWSPENEPSRRPEIKTRPELAMLLDGAPAGLDVTWFMSTEVGGAAARAARVRDNLEAGLREHPDDGRSTYGFVVYVRDHLLSLSRRDLTQQTQGLLKAFQEAIGATSGSANRVPIKVPYPWVRDATLTLTPSGSFRERVSVVLLPPRSHARHDIDAFVQARIASKGPQLAPWGLGILVIIRGGDEHPDEVAAGLARARAIPWWRVYWVGPSPEHVHQVAG